MGLIEGTGDGGQVGYLDGVTLLHRILIGGRMVNRHRKGHLHVLWVHVCKDDFDAFVCVCLCVFVYVLGRLIRKKTRKQGKSTGDGLDLNAQNFLKQH